METSPPVHYQIEPHSLIVWFLTHVLAVSLLMQVLLGFLLLRGFLVSGNQACWLMLELGENIPETKVLESNKGVCMKSTAESDTTLRNNSTSYFCLCLSVWLSPGLDQHDSASFGWSVHLHYVGSWPYPYVVCIHIFLLFNPAINLLWMAINMVLSQMLSSRVMSCAHALLVMISLVLEAHFDFFFGDVFLTLSSLLQQS